MANTPPSRSYRFFSDVVFSAVVCWACAWVLSAPAKATGAAVAASPATTLRLVRELVNSWAIGHLLVMVRRSRARDAGLAGFVRCNRVVRMRALSTCLTGALP